MRVFELGGGMGTCAMGILEHVRVAAPEVYARMTYTSVEISAPLARWQDTAVGAAHGARHGGGAAHHYCFQLNFRTFEVLNGVFLSAARLVQPVSRRGAIAPVCYPLSGSRTID